MFGRAGNGTLDAAVNALGNQLQIISYEEKSLGSGADASAIAIIECHNSLKMRLNLGLENIVMYYCKIGSINVSNRFDLSPIVKIVTRLVDCLLLNKRLVTILEQIHLTQALFAARDK